MSTMWRLVTMARSLEPIATTNAVPWSTLSVPTSSANCVTALYPQYRNCFGRLWNMEEALHLAGVSAVAVRACSRRRVRRLDGGKELRRVASLLARSITRPLAASEGHVVVDARRRHIDHHHPRLRVTLEVRRMLQRCRDDARTEPERRVVRQRQRLVVILRADDARHRAEDLLARDAHRIGG